MLPFTDTQQQKIIEKIKYDSNKQITNKQITRNILEQWRDSEIIKDMLTAQQYFLVKNTEIKNKSRDYIDADGHNQTNNTLSNAKLANAYIRNSVIQKVDYAFGKPFVLTITNNLQNDEEQTDKQLELYLDEWNKFIDDSILETISRVATDAVNKGIGWCYIWIDELGQLQLVEVEPDTVYPAWQDKPHTKLNAIVRDYKVIEYDIDTPVIIQKVEYWDSNVVEKYIEINNELIIDVYAEQFVDGEIKELPESLATAHMKNDKNGVSWGKVPFIDLKGNDDELPLLNVVKSFIDAHDKLNSKSVDTILDDIDSVLVLVGMSPETGGLIKARQIMQSSRIVAVDEGGSASFLKVDTNIQSVETKLESLKKNIREFTATVDTQDVKFGANPSGEALKAMYQDLDTYTNKLEKKFKSFMLNLKYFFDKWLEFRNIGTVEQWNNYKLDVKLDRDMMINNSALIDDVVKLNGLISQETLDNYNPAVSDHATEQARREKDQKTMQEQNELIRFETDLKETK